MRTFQDVDLRELEGGPSWPGMAPGKRTLTQHLAAPVQRTTEAGPASGPAPVPASDPGAGRGEDPFAIHLLGGRNPSAGGVGGMSAGLQSRMESSFGYDLSSVNVHQDGAADAMDARAFARGTDIHFAAGELDAESPAGQHLMAHEMAHIVQQAMGRAPVSVQTKLANMLGDDPLEAEADAMADRALRGEPAWAGADHGPLRTLPSLSGGPVMPKLKVGAHWYKVAETIAQYVVRDRGDAQVVALLQRWGRDNTARGRDFASWGEAIQAARLALDESDSEERDDDDGGGGGPAEWSTLRKVMTAFILFLLLGAFAGMVYQGLRPYEVRPNMQNTAVTMRRELEPAMQFGHQLDDLAQQPVTEIVRAHVVNLPVAQFLDGNPMLELAAPDLARLRDLGPLLDQIAPQLDALGPMLQQVQPVLRQVGLHTLDTPASTGFHHMHIMLQPPPTISDVPGNGLDEAEGMSPLHPTDLGFFHDGVHPDRPDMMPTYGPALHTYDRDLMERAAIAVAADYGHYKGITHNCQDYVDAVVTAYKELGGREIVPTHRSAVLLAISDYLIAYGSTLLDNAVAGALQGELAALPKAENGGSPCAQAVSHKLGLAPGTFAGTIDALLDQSFVVPDRGPTSVRKLLCEPFDPHTVDVGLGLASVGMDVPFEMPEEGRASVRDALCTPKGGSNALEGLVFELARVKGEAQIVAELSSLLPAFVMEDPLVRNKLVGDLVSRLARQLYGHLNLKGLC